MVIISLYLKISKSKVSYIIEFGIKRTFRINHKIIKKLMMVS